MSIDAKLKELEAKQKRLLEEKSAANKEKTLRQGIVQMMISDAKRDGGSFTPEVAAANKVMQESARAAARESGEQIKRLEGLLRSLGSEIYQLQDRKEEESLANEASKLNADWLSSTTSLPILAVSTLPQNRLNLFITYMENEGEDIDLAESEAISLRDFLLEKYPVI